jgi:hypothetical protein
MKTVFMLWSEWDIGESNVAFVSTEAGHRWLLENEAMKEIAEEDNLTVERCIADCFDQGFFNWMEIEVVQ